MSNEEPGLTQAQQIGERRNQILDAAIAVFALKGAHRATVREVARAAGVADGTIYNYFENKDALLLGILDRLNQTEQRSAHFAQSTEMSLAGFVDIYLRQRLEHLTGDGLDVLRVLFSELLINAPLRGSYYQEVLKPTLSVADESFKRWQESGHVPLVDPQLATRTLASMVVGVIVLRLLGDEYLQEHWEELPEFLSAFVQNGLNNSIHNSTR